MIHFGEQWYLWTKTDVIDLMDLEVWRGKWQVGEERTDKGEGKEGGEGREEREFLIVILNT